MKSTKEIGDAGEDEAVGFLQGHDYKIAVRNFRTRFGEIDIIASDGKMLVFVEVKMKSSPKYGTAAEMITARKLWKITKMANAYIQEIGYQGPWRIDAVLINKYSIELIKNLTLGGGE